MLCAACHTFLTAMSLQTLLQTPRASMGSCGDENRCASSNHLDKHATVDLHVSYVGPQQVRVALIGWTLPAQVPARLWERLEP
jgi:hypothetical protein